LFAGEMDIFWKRDSTRSRNCKARAGTGWLSDGGENGCTGKPVLATPRA
jgi:hypothetical protein